MKTRVRISILLLLATVVLFTAALLASCGPQEVEKPPDQVSVRLKWLHSTQFAGLYVAEQEGFYAEENIQVTLTPGGPDHDELELVASGQDDFGTISAPQVLLARGKGLPIVTIAVIFRINPTVYFALQESGIERPEDFIGRKVRISSTDFVLPAMLAKLGIDMDQLEAAPPDAGMDAFFAGEVDVWAGYLTSQVVTARQQGYELNIIYPDDYGIHIHNDLIITTERMIQEKPELVERFLRATLRGWRYAIENSEEAVAMILRYDEELDEASARAQVEAQIPLVHTGEDQIGWMRAGVWEGMHDILLEQGILDKPVDVDKAYTMEFLQKVYGDE